jgi:hypothetical protein
MISRDTFETQDIANMVYLLHPELVSKLDVKTIVRHTFEVMGFCTRYAKRGVVIPYLGVVTPYYIWHRDPTPEKQGRRQKWKWRVNMNKCVGGRKKNWLRRWDDDQAREMGHPVRDYRQDRIDKFMILVEQYKGVTAEEYWALPEEERKPLGREVRQLYLADRRLQYEKDRRAKEGGEGLEAAVRSPGSEPPVCGEESGQAL